MVAVGYGPINEINKTVLEEIGGDNILIMNSSRDSGYASYASQVKDMVCGKLWNNLPLFIRNVTSVSSFKKTLKTSLFKKAFL